MLNKLISLVFLLLILNSNLVYSETNFLLPLKKPSIFKQTNKEIKETISKNLPIPKPKIQKQEQSKTEKKKEENKVVVKEEFKKKLSSSLFVYPKKKSL